jgi:hypothetical protein
MERQPAKFPITLNLDEDVISALDAFTAAHNKGRIRTSRSAIANSILASQLCGDLGRNSNEQQEHGQSATTPA